MMRLSAAFTRRASALLVEADDAVGLMGEAEEVLWIAKPASRGDEAVFRASPSEEGTEPMGIEDDLEESSSQTSMVNILWSRIMKGCC
jgi:hypothetical protein